jgi:hypothetical protein
MLIKWKSFADERFNLRGAAGRETTYALDIYVGRKGLVHVGILLFSSDRCL